MVEFSSNLICDNELVMLGLCLTLMPSISAVYPSLVSLASPVCPLSVYVFCLGVALHLTPAANSSAQLQLIHSSGYYRINTAVFSTLARLFSLPMWYGCYSQVCNEASYFVMLFENPRLTCNLCLPA